MDEAETGPLKTVAHSSYDKRTVTPSSEPSDFDVKQWLVTEDRRYVSAGEFAKGGIGRILEARDSRLDRSVAIKELLSDSGEDESRFLREALITSRLQHPSIVPIHDLGIGRTGKPFYVMKLIRGSSLAQLIKKTKDFTERLALLPNVIAVADAIAYAHAERIIHRDLKPANIIVGRFGETVVVDWGLAADLRFAERPAPGDPKLYELIASDLTLTGTVMGTPEYMPPEQAHGQRVDERADVYAIGAILYHVLSGQPPYRGPRSTEVIQRVKKEEPKPIELREPKVPRELAAIVRKAMARETAERYPTAKQLSEDLKRFQTGQWVYANTEVARDLSPELSVRALRSLVLSFERRFGRSRLETIWTKQKLGLSIEHLSNPTHFVSYSYGQRLIDVLSAESGDPDFVSKAAMLTSTPEVLGFAHTLLKACGSPGIAYSKMVNHSSTFNKVGQFRIERLQNSHMVLTYQSYVVEPNRNLCKFRIAQFASIPMIWGLPAAHATELTCQVNGDDRCRYELTWVRYVRRWKRYFGLGLGIAVGVGFWALNLTALSIAIPCFSTLGLVLGAWLDDRAEFHSKEEWFLNTQDEARVDAPNEQRLPDGKVLPQDDLPTRR